MGLEHPQILVFVTGPGLNHPWIPRANYTYNCNFIIARGYKSEPAKGIDAQGKSWDWEGSKYEAPGSSGTQYLPGISVWQYAENCQHSKLTVGLVSRVFTEVHCRGMID